MPPPRGTWYAAVPRSSCSNSQTDRCENESGTGPGAGRVADCALTAPAPRVRHFSSNASFAAESLLESMGAIGLLRVVRGHAPTSALARHGGPAGPCGVSLPRMRTRHNAKRRHEWESQQFANYA